MQTPNNTYTQSSENLQIPRETTHTYNTIQLKSRFHLQYFKLIGAIFISFLCVGFSCLLVLTRESLDAAACSLVSFIIGSFLAYLSNKDQKNGPSN